MPTVREILDELRTKPTVSVPSTGKVLGDLSPNAAYQAAKDGTLGVPTFWIGGKIRVPSIEVLRKLGLADEARSASTDQPADILPPPTSPEPALRRSSQTRPPKGASRSEAPQES